MHVSHTGGEGCFTEQSITTCVQVLAPSVNEATLTALEMVAARGRCPVSITVDWDNF